jgi:NTP pyrophosphatase (non-canonical NTP hydrolase)
MKLHWPDLRLPPINLWSLPYMSLSLLYTYQKWTSKTAVYPSDPKKPELASMYVALGLAGEAGEVANKIKKWYRDGVLDVDSVRKELGDVLWYAARLAEELGFSLEDTLTENMNKLNTRLEKGTIKGSGDNR